MFDFHLMKTHCVKSSTGANTQRVGGPHLELGSVFYWVQIKHFGGCAAHACFHCRRRYIARRPVACIINTQRDFLIGFCDFGMACQDAHKVCNKTHCWAFGIADE